MTAWPYSTQDGSGNFLHIDVKMFGAEVGNNIQLSLNTRHQNPAAKEQITHFTILVRDEEQDLSQGIFSLEQSWLAELEEL